MNMSHNEYAKMLLQLEKMINQIEEFLADYKQKEEVLRKRDERIAEDYRTSHKTGRGMGKNLGD